MNILEKGGAHSLLKLYDNEVVATNFHLQRDFPSLESQALSITFAEYTEVLEHTILEPLILHRNPNDKNVILVKHALKTHLWFEIYKKFGKSLFKILFGCYEVFQRLPDSASYIQVSGLPLSQLPGFGSKLYSPKSTTTPVTSCESASTSTQNNSPKSRLWGKPMTLTTQRDDRNTTLGSHMFMFKQKLRTDPDRLFSRMTYFKWYKEAFDVRPVGVPNPHLKSFLMSLKSTKLGLIFSNFTHQPAADPKDLFKCDIPQWKIKMLLKRLLTEIGIPTLIGSENFLYLIKGLCMLFTCNRFTKLKPSFLTRAIKMSQCKWLDDKTLSHKVKYERLTKLILWIVRLINYCFGFYFYVTETREYKKRPMFYSRRFWEEKSQATLQQYIDKGIFTKSKPANANYQLRFMAGRNKLRPILTRVASNYHSRRRFALLDTLPCLKYVRDNSGNCLAECASPLASFRAFGLNRRRHGLRKKLYYVKADIEKCYDSIDRSLLITILNKLVQQMDIQSFTLCKIAVVLSGTGGFTVTYIDQIFTNQIGGFSSVSKFCQEHMKSKGITSAVFVPIRQIEIPSSRLIQTVKEHLENVTICVKNGKLDEYYTMTNGIIQGSMISPVLCDIYYSHMERHCFDVELKSPAHLLLRNVDDYLLLTYDKQVAVRFLQALFSPMLPDSYNCVIQPSKTSTNVDIDLYDCMHEIHNDSSSIQWCQYVIDLYNSYITIPQYSAGDIENSLSFKGTVKPLLHMKQALLKFICVYANPVYLDHKINNNHTVRQNIEEILRMCAVRSVYTYGYLPDQNSTQKNPQVLVDMIMCCASKLYKIYANNSRRRGDRVRVTKSYTTRCCLRQFIKVYNSHPQHKVLTHHLNRRLHDHLKKTKPVRFSYKSKVGHSQNKPST